MSLNCERQDVSRAEGAWKPPRTGGLPQAGYPTEAGTWKCTQRVCWLIPSNSKQNHSGCNYFLSAAVWWLIFQFGTGEFSFQIQTVKWDPITAHMRCSGGNMMTELCLKRWGGWDLCKPRANHVASTTKLERNGLMYVLNSDAKAHQKQGRGQGCMSSNAGIAPQWVPLHHHHHHQQKGWGEGDVSTGLAVGGRRKEKGGREPACFLWDTNQLLAALNSSVWGH